MEETTPGLSAGGISGDIFDTPSGAAWEAVQLIFGDWLQLVFEEGGSGSATIMTHVAGYINFLSYILITVIMAYVLISAVIKTAAEGKVMGNGYSAVWLPLRTFLACFLIFPVGIGAASTISFVQVAVSWLGMVGSNAADRVAEFVVGNLERRAFTTSVDINGYKTIQDMTDMGFCVAGFNYAFDKKGGEVDRPADLYAEVAGEPKWELNGPNTYGISASQVPVKVAVNESLADEYNVINLGHDGSCGSIRVNAIEGEKELAQDIMRLNLRTQVKVFDEVVQPLLDLNRNATTINHLYSNNDTVHGDDIKDSVNAVIIRQIEIMNEYEDEVSDLLVGEAGANNDRVDYNNVDGNITVGINTSAFNEQGWAYLGAYYTILSNAIGSIHELSQTAENTTNNAITDGCSITKTDRNTIKNFFSLGNKKELTDEVCYYSDRYEIVKVVNSQSAKISSENGDLDRRFSATCNEDNYKGCDGEFVENVFASKISKSFRQDTIVEDGSSASIAQSTIGLLGWGNNPSTIGFNDVESSDGTASGLELGALYISDPIAFTSELGRSIVYTLHGLRLSLNVVNGLSTALENAGIPFANSIPAFIGGTLSAVADYLGVILTIMYPSAATMAYFIPLVPALIWGMAFISWLMMYAEAIFMAPLAVTLMATPEGEGISGSRMERKIALLAALILKPTLLIVGLLLSMMILSIGFVFLNQIFWISAGSNFRGFDLIAIIALITTWVSIFTVFMHNCFKIIPTFADNALEWFLGGIAKPFGNDLDNTTSNEFKGTASNTSDVGTSTANYAGKSIGMFASNRSRSD